MDANDPARRWDADRSLLATFVDRWRPKTHMLHLPCGEVTLTLKDVAYLLGLSIAGDAVGPISRGQFWKDVTTLFSQVSRRPEVGGVERHPTLLDERTDQGVATPLYAQSIGPFDEY